MSDGGVNYDDAFAPSTVGNSEGRRRIENNACRQVLRLRQINPAAVAKAAGLGPRDSLTFKALREATGFGVSPSVTDTPVDPFDRLTLKFETTNLWAAWVAAWDERRDIPPADRALVADSVGWGRVVLHPDTAAVETRAGLVLHAGRTRLVLEVLRPWADAIWTASDPDSR